MIASSADSGVAKKPDEAWRHSHRVKVFKFDQGEGESIRIATEQRVRNIEHAGIALPQYIQFSNGVTEIANVAGYDYTALRGRETKLLDIGTPVHPFLVGGLHVESATPAGAGHRMRGVLIEVKAPIFPCDPGVAASVARRLPAEDTARISEMDERGDRI